MDTPVFKPPDCCFLVDFQGNPCRYIDENSQSAAPKLSAIYSQRSESFIGSVTLAGKRTGPTTFRELSDFARELVKVLFYR